MSVHEKRCREFIWYHMNGDGDCNGQVLRAYADMNGLREQERYDLAFFYSVTPFRTAASVPCICSASAML